MSVKIVKVIECPHCGDIVAIEDKEKLKDAFKCSECDDIHETKEDAELCCKE